VNNLYTPLEQFEIKVIIPLEVFRFLDISIINSTVYIFLSMLGILLLFSLGTYRSTLIPNTYQMIVESIYMFVLGMVKQQAGKKGIFYFPLLLVVFLFILFQNLIGLLPLSFTVTSHIAITLLLALGFNIGFLILAFFKHGIAYLGFFVPSGAPAALLPLIVVIEVASYCLRTLSLSIRLFANMMAGHTLLHILTSFTVAFLKSPFPFFAIFSVVLILAVLFLELAISFLQAYVFTIMLSIYLNDSLNLSH